MYKLETKAVAAAILLHRGDELHVTTLTNLIKESKLTTLGLRGGTPRQTLSTILNREWKYFRSGKFRGYYALRDGDVGQFQDVREAVERYEGFRASRELEMTKDQLIASLRDELKMERRRHRSVLDKLKRISAICGSKGR